jgi:hypothetical protein
MVSVSLSSADLCGRTSDGDSPAGAGKTKLVSRVIDRISDSPRGQALAYFYCDRNEDTRRDPESILRSFVKQLSFSLNEGAVQNALIEIYREKQRTGFASAKLTLEESKRLIPILIQSYLKVILVLDALDESRERVRADLIEYFSYLVDNFQHVKIFISSRRDDDIKHQLEKKANVGIEATDNRDDISKFVVKKIDQGQKHRRNAISESLRKEIVQTLLEKSQGM